ncbi:hypothetical protein Sdia_08160 [Streptomyces diastaticus subsp. diastaticus]|uniref:Uncharacterized protein n=1 Tax=Streptomyces diastaticus subsp. diastaticus TaxID=68040 RepID=A0ABQ1CIT1_STRDI|nr:hypothetical protein Sdia_08160 [Streptomyces diastaticus subsp. diastaticus]GGU38296.1 hypothetical protein GCM10015534_46280 [Streptomyces diastaticus subsp. diastaticus]
MDALQGAGGARFAVAERARGAGGGRDDLLRAVQLAADRARLRVVLGWSSGEQSREEAGGSNAPFSSRRRSTPRMSDAAPRLTSTVGREPPAPTSRQSVTSPA